MTTQRKPILPDRVYDFDALVREDRVHRSLYTDPAIFNLEMTRVFGAVWVYLAHESQVPRPNDFLRVRLGLRPLILVRDTKGALRALYNRCTHRGATVCREARGSAKAFQCPYHGWTYHNTGKLAGVPWPEGYSCDFSRAEFNLMQVPRVESYRGFIFGTLNADAPALGDYLGPVRRPLDEWLDRHPGGALEVREANRLKFNGNWKLAYDNSADGYHVVFSHRSLLMMENRFLDEDGKGMSYYKNSPDSGPVKLYSFPNAHHFKDKRDTVAKRPGALWEIEGLHPGMEHYEAKLRRDYPDRADALLDLASSEPVNINVFPNLHILGNHIQVTQPLSVTETATTWYGTAVVDPDGEARPGAGADQRAAHAHPGTVPDLRRGRRPDQFRGNPDRARRRGGRMGLHAPRPRPAGALQRRRRRHDDRPGDRRSVHARRYAGLPAADADRAEHRADAGGLAMASAAEKDPSKSSWYVGDAFYESLVAALRRLGPGRARDPRSGAAGCGSRLP